MSVDLVWLILSHATKYQKIGSRQERLLVLGPGSSPAHVRPCVFAPHQKKRVLQWLIYHLSKVLKIYLSKDKRTAQLSNICLAE